MVVAILFAMIEFHDNTFACYLVVRVRMGSTPWPSARPRPQPGRRHDRPRDHGRGRVDEAVAGLWPTPRPDQRRGATRS